LPRVADVETENRETAGQAVDRADGAPNIEGKIDPIARGRIAFRMQSGAGGWCGARVR
jgi:hypothetical protein